MAAENEELFLEEMATNTIADLTMTIDYTGTPSPTLVTQLNNIASQFPDHHITIHWNRSEPQEEHTPTIPGGAQAFYHGSSIAGEGSEDQQPNRFYRDHPKGYRRSHVVPVLRGPSHCSSCLCAPCVIGLPPDFLRGTCGPHAANSEKRHRLYRLFWKLLKDLGVWHDAEYLERKAERTTRDDRRDILPHCVIEEVRSRYPSFDGHYRDYLSTFDAALMFDES